ncbi:hypothetical protein JCM6882_000855 [Rhodosporidiobolus microsporus]
MSFSALPRELREEIVRLVGEQDRVFQARQNGSPERELAFLDVLGKGWCGRGLIALGEVNKDLRSLVLPVLFNPVRLARFKPADLYTFPTTQIGQLCRAVSFATDRTAGYGSSPWYGDIARFKDALQMLDQLPQLREVDLSGCSEHLVRLLRRLTKDEQPATAPTASASNGAGTSGAARDEDDSSEGDEDSDSEDDWDDSWSDEDGAAPLNTALFSKISFTGSRVTSWTFDRVDPGITLAFLSLNPSIITRLDIYDPLSRAESSSSIEPAVDATTFVSRIASLPSLTSLTLRVHDDASGSTERPSLHPAWATTPFLSASALTSLSLSIPRVNYTKPVAAFVNTFADSLRSLSLNCGVTAEVFDLPPRRFPNLHVLSLTSLQLPEVACLYRAFDTPALRTLELAVRDPPAVNEAPISFNSFNPGGSLTRATPTPLLQTVRLGIDPDNPLAKPWPEAQVARLARGFTSSPLGHPIRVETAWSQVEDLDAGGAALAASLGKVKDLAAWMVDQAARIEVTRDEAAARRLVETARMVAGLREYERE